MSGKQAVCQGKNKKLKQTDMYERVKVRKQIKDKKISGKQAICEGKQETETDTPVGKRTSKETDKRRM